MTPIKTMLCLTALISGLSGCANRAVRTQLPEEEQIRTLVARFLDAVNAADTRAFVGFFAKDATAFFPTNAARRIGIEEIENAVKPAFAQGPRSTPATPRDLRISVSGRIAVATFDAGSGDMHARRTLVLDRSNGVWKIAHLHASNVSSSR